MRTANPMDAKHNPAYLRSVRDALEGFLVALRDYLSLHDENTFMPGLMPAIVAKEDASPDDIAALGESVGRAAGKAARAVGLAGGHIAVDGLGVVDPIANWYTMAQPKPVVSPRDVKSAAAYMIGRLEGMIAEAELVGPPPVVGVSSMHPAVVGAALKLWDDGHYRAAVVAAGDAVEQLVRTRTGRKDLPGTAVMQNAFGPSDPKAGDPRLRWPGDPDADQSVKSMREGLSRFAPGAQMTIRNMATHNQAEEWTQQDALERLSALSLLARWTDGCDTVSAGEQDDSASKAAPLSAEAV